MAIYPKERWLSLWIEWDEMSAMKSQREEKEDEKVNSKVRAVKPL